MNKKRQWKKLIEQQIEVSLNKVPKEVEEKSKNRQEELRNTLGNLMRDIGASENEIARVEAY